MPSIFKTACCGDRSILAHQEYLVTFKLMTSQVIQTARPLSANIWDLGWKRVNRLKHTVKFRFQFLSIFRQKKTSPDIIACLFFFFFWFVNMNSAHRSSRMGNNVILLTTSSNMIKENVQYFKSAAVIKSRHAASITHLNRLHLL